MIHYCEDCGAKFKSTDKYCSKCGNKRLSQKGLHLFSKANYSVYKVLFFQVLLFFIYPIHYLKRKLDIFNKSSKFVTFSYHLIYILVLTMLVSGPVRFVWLTASSKPSENDLIFGFSNMLFVGPYVLWFLTYVFIYIICIIKSVRLINLPLGKDNKIKHFWALLLGIVYIQYKINKISVQDTDIDSVISKPYISRYQKLVFSGLAVLLILGLTSNGKILLTYGRAVSGAYSIQTNEASMDFMGKYLLLSSNPVRTSMDEVASKCGNKLDTSFSLGCNVQVADKFSIYISTVNEPSLHGVEVYSIAHEMLHTAYAKLSPTEKTEIDKSLNDLYPKIMSSNDTITKRALEPYKDKTDDDLTNELHSIVLLYNGDIGSVLENHYKKFFKDRGALGNVYKKSEQIILSLENQLDLYDASLKSFEKSLSEGATIIQQQKNSLNNFGYNGNTYTYNLVVNSINKNIDTYNDNYSKYEKNYNTYTNIYSSYKDLMSALRRNTSYSQESQISNGNYTKAK